MRRPLFIVFMCTVLLAGGAAFAEPGEADITVSGGQPNVPSEDAAIGNIPGGAEVSVTDGRLSVTAQNAAIGNILSSISQQAGFELDINPEVSLKTVTTKFTNMDIQRGIERLLALIRQKDYFIYYKPDGDIRKLEVHGPSDAGSPAMQRSRRPRQTDFRRRSPVRMPPRPQMRRTPSLPNSRNTSPSARPSTQRGTATSQPGVGMPAMPVNPGSSHTPVPSKHPVQNAPEGVVTVPPPQPDDMGSTPYIPPARMPAYIPPKH